MFGKKPRPKIRPPRTKLDIVFESIAIGALLYGFILVFQNWSTLPATIPTHFDAQGNADGWGPKGMIWLLPSIGVVMIPLMLFLRRFPWLSNVPIQITEKNAEVQYGLIVKLLGFLAANVSLLFLALVYDTISIAGGGTSLLGVWFMPVCITPIVGCLFWYFIRAFRAR